MEDKRILKAGFYLIFGFGLIMLIAFFLLSIAVEYFG
jgi:hypothetical protein